MKLAQNYKETVLILNDKEFLKFKKDNEFLFCDICKAIINPKKENFYFCNKVKSIICNFCILKPNPCKHGNKLSLFPESLTIADIEHVHPKISRIIKE